MRVHIGVRSAPSVRAGGLERASDDNIRALSAAGVDVCVHAPPHDAPRAPHVPVPWPGWNGGPGRPTFAAAYLTWMVRLAASLDRCWADGDVLLLHGAASGALARLRAAPPSAAVVNPHGMEEFGPRSLLHEVNRAPLRRAARRGAALAHGLIATDTVLVAEVARNFPQCRRTVLIPNAVDVARLDDLAARAQPDPAVPGAVVSVGRLVPNKGYDLLAAALVRLAARDEPVTWVHLGAGPEIRRITGIVRGNEHVRFVHRDGATDAAVQSALARCRVFVQPSRYEGSSLSVLEAMAARAVVVATPVGGIPDKIIDGRTGYLAAAPAVPALVEALRRAGASAAPDAVRSQARQLVEARFGLDAQACAYRALLHDVVSGSDRVRH